MLFMFTSRTSQNGTIVHTVLYSTYRNSHVRENANQIKLKSKKRSKTSWSSNKKVPQVIFDTDYGFFIDDTLALDLIAYSGNGMGLKYNQLMEIQNSVPSVLD